MLFPIPPPAWTSIKGLLRKIPKSGVEVTKHLFGGGRREASVPAGKKKRFVCLSDENILLPALHRQLAASQENRAAALGKL